MVDTFSTDMSIVTTPPPSTPSPSQNPDRDGTGGGLIAFVAGLFEEERGNRAMDDLQHRCEQVGMDGEQAA